MNRFLLVIIACAAVCSFAVASECIGQEGSGLDPNRACPADPPMTNVLDSRYLAITAIVTVAYQFSFFLITYFCRFDKVTDFAGGTNFLVLALLTYFLSDGSHPRQIVLTALVGAWALRLALFLLYRIILWGEDRRFDDKRDNLANLAVFWSLQAVWVWTVHLPVTILNSKTVNPPISGVDIFGWGLFTVGLVGESIADMQKLYFKQDPESRGKWIDVGLWYYSRHPNYFFEQVVWIGAFVSACRVFSGVDWIAVLGPIFIILLLLFVSGIPLTESSADKKHGAKAEYRAYKGRTSVLIPIPPALYEGLPEAVKTTLLLDFPLYNSYKKHTADETAEDTPIVQ